jgi:hypothetical protein
MGKQGIDKQGMGKQGGGQKVRAGAVSAARLALPHGASVPEMGRGSASAKGPGCTAQNAPVSRFPRVSVHFVSFQTFRNVPNNPVSFMISSC